MTNLHEEHLNLIEEYQAFKTSTSKRIFDLEAKHTNEMAEKDKLLAALQKDNAALVSENAALVKENTTLKTGKRRAGEDYLSKLAERQRKLLQSKELQ